MELKHYLRILLGKWWLILIAIVVTVVPTYYYVNNQPWIYESTATFVIRPRASSDADAEGFVKAVDTLSNRVEINTTFAEVASSSVVKDRAQDALNLSGPQRRGLKVDSRVIAGTNVLEISVQGLDPVVVRDVAEAVSIETVDYVSGLYDVFELEPLDLPEQSNKPVSPNKTLNLAMGGFFGVLLGMSLVFLLEYLKETEAEDTDFNIIDPETGVYNKTYFMLRLRQEMSRAWRNRYSLSIALLEVNNRSLASGESQQVLAAKALPQVTVSLGPNLRDEDILAHLGDSTFALLLPDMPGKAAKDLLEEVRSKIGLLSSDEVETEKGLTTYGAIGIATHQNNSVSPEGLVAQASLALEEARTSSYGKVNLFATPVESGTHESINDNNDMFAKDLSLRNVVESRKVRS